MGYQYSWVNTGCANNGRNSTISISWLTIRIEPRTHWLENLSFTIEIKSQLPSAVLREAQLTL